MQYTYHARKTDRCMRIGKHMSRIILVYADVHACVRTGALTVQQAILFIATTIKLVRVVDIDAIARCIRAPAVHSKSNRTNRARQSAARFHCTHQCCSIDTYYCITLSGCLMLLLCAFSVRSLVSSVRVGRPCGVEVLETRTRLDAANSRGMR
jgi:hypothetical protein